MKGVCMIARSIEEQWREWVASKPECVRKLIEEFPVGSKFNIDGKMFYLLGYTEDDSLMVSDIDPAVDYEGANNKKTYICAKHVRRE